MKFPKNFFLWQSCLPGISCSAFVDFSVAAFTDHAQLLVALHESGRSPRPEKKYTHGSLMIAPTLFR